MTPTKPELETRAKNCVTHSICDCQQLKQERLTEAVEVMREALELMDCKTANVALDRVDELLGE